MPALVVAQLGEWNTQKALQLQRTANGNWFIEVELPVGTSFEYRYLVRDTKRGTMMLETGIHRNMTLSDERLAALPLNVMVVDSWQFPMIGETKTTLPTEMVARVNKVQSESTTTDPTGGWQTKFLKLQDQFQQLKQVAK